MVHLPLQGKAWSGGVAVKYHLLGAVGETAMKPVVERSGNSNGSQGVEEIRVWYFIECHGHVEK